ncbi:MAG: Cytidylate kinase [Firmicutes bacterium ADurb.Bin182]|nr:MAG: Cytidylate kinase [Firmicutes bacterium ADurb.Bin182]
MNKLNIAIDGPAGAGKSTIAKHVSEHLGILYLDTGAMYRAMALKAIRSGIDPNDKDSVEKLLPKTDIDIRYLNGKQHVILDGEDVSDSLRTPEISKGASDIAVIPSVRIKMVEKQREIASKYDTVIDGRDIGSYVLPNADFKFYVTATVKVRAERRMSELSAAGNLGNRTFENVYDELISRDKTDSTREFAPLIKPPDSILIDTTDLCVSEAVRLVLEYIKSH